MLQIIIDIGNTLVKTTLFKDGEWLPTERSATAAEAFETLWQRCVAWGEERPEAILSTVGVLSDEWRRWLSERFRLLELTPQTPVPLINHYATPNTLGSDRLAAAVGATVLFPNENLLIFDAGSCLTWDFVDREKHYHGGGIAPGIEMRLKSLHHFTAKLPLIAPDFADDLLGKSTADCIKAGCVNAVVLEVDAIIDQFRVQHQPLKVILCGGDAEMLQRKTKNNTFARQNLVQLGLKEILDFNETK